MTNNLTPEEQRYDSAMGPFRERVAALIAILVIVVALAMTAFTFHYIGDSERFGQAKDLLLIINPVLGVVVGYYFNKVSTEARAETAERTARSASTDARRAAELRENAETVANAAKTDTEEMRQHLEEVSQAAEMFLAQTPARGPVTLGTSDVEKPVDTSRRALEAALVRAKRKRRP